MSGCSCDYGDAEQPQFFTCKTVKARKQSKCSECGNVIHPGSKYERVSGKWDGDVRSYRTCSDCLDFLAWAKAHVPCVAECRRHGTLHEDILEEMDNWDHECPGLHAEAKAKSAAIFAKRLAA